MRPELIVAGKEFRDHISSKRFIIIFAILMLLSIYSMVNGMGQYNQMLDQYKQNAQTNPQQQWYQDQVASLQMQIQDAASRGAADEVRQLQFQLDELVNPPMPSMLFIFGDLTQYFVLIAMVLSVAIGFDLISREKEEGSLKSLLSHPLYRDAIINGKALGAIAVLAVSLAAMFLLTSSIMLFYGVVPGGDDILRIVVYFLMAMLYCSVFFALALMTSTIAKSSAMSVLYVLGIVIAMVIIPMLSYQIAGLVLGSPPQVPAGDDGGAVLYNNVVKDSAAIAPEPIQADSRMIAWNDEVQQYYQRLSLVTTSINAISPISSFRDNIASAIIYKAGGGGMITPMVSVSSFKPYMPTQAPTIWDSLMTVWGSILAMLVELVIPLAVSYVFFLRMDVR
ncbi:MAG TPA: ABC transporter permease subunit [Methanocellaceae archaeon]